MAEGDPSLALDKLSLVDKAASKPHQQPDHSQEQAVSADWNEAQAAAADVSDTASASSRSSSTRPPPPTPSSASTSSASENGHRDAQPHGEAPEQTTSQPPIPPSTSNMTPTPTPTQPPPPQAPMLTPTLPGSVPGSTATPAGGAPGTTPTPTAAAGAPTPTPTSAPHLGPTPTIPTPTPTSALNPTPTAPGLAGRAPGGVAAGPPGMQGMRPGAGRPGRGPMAGPMGMRAAAAHGAAAPMPTRLPPSLQAKMDKLAAQRSGTPSPAATNGLGPAPAATSMGALLRSQALRKPAPPPGQAGPSVIGPNAGPLGLAARRQAGGSGRPPMTLPTHSAPGGLAGARRGGIAGRRGPPGGLSLAQMQGHDEPSATSASKFSDFKTIMDPSGSLMFSKAVLNAQGVEFGDGQSFKINMDEMDVLGELGKGNYGSVQKVFHRPTGVMMAMKEIRLELDESKLNGIIMELDILHRAVAPEIVEFYGAFTIESCVYYCMEYMDGGSLDKLTASGQTATSGEPVGDDDRDMPLIPEPVLRRLTAAIVRGLRFLKDELQIMHRDVKPTNVLINTKGEVKLCDFGVSGQLEKSLAKTNIGCQSYMAPERIKGESQNQVSTYTVSSDVWSVGLTVVEIAKGCYPYPPETFANVFAQLTAIVNGLAPTLPKGYSDDANDFVAKCLLKDPNARPTYAQLLEHPFLLADKGADVDMAGWVAQSLERQSARGVTPLAGVEA